MSRARWAALACLLAGSVLVAYAVHPGQQLPPSPVDEYLAWLDDPSRQWLATAELQRFPDAAIPRLLEPARATLGPHGTLTPALLALAKIGEPAIPVIAARLRALWSAGAPDRQQRAYPLIEVLRTIGPAAAPALLELRELTDPDDPAARRYALSAIAAMEPPGARYGQVVSPWARWRTPDDRLARLERAIRPLLPRIEREMDRDQSTSFQAQPAAYLLARWGRGPQRTRGLQVLEERVRTAADWHTAVEVLRELYRLKAPATASLIRLTAPRVPATNELQAASLLAMAVALQQLGEHDYGSLVDEAIRRGRPVDRLEAAAFLGRTEDFANLPRLLALLDDTTVWSGRDVAGAALTAVQRLTLQDLPAERSAWHAWVDANRGVTYQTVSGEWLDTARRSIKTVPIWTANKWIEKIRWTRDPRVLPLVADYLRRADLAASAIGPNSSSGGTGDGPNGTLVPAVVTLLLGLAQQGAPGAIDALESCLRAADPEVRWLGAMALAAYRPRTAVAGLAGGLQASEPWRRAKVGGFLLLLGDARGIPARIEALEAGAALYGQGTFRVGDATDSQTIDASRGIRMFACRDLRVYTQQPLACDPAATGAVLAAQVSAWRAWWLSTRGGFKVRSREAQLDLALQYQVHPVTMGASVVR